MASAPMLPPTSSLRVCPAGPTPSSDEHAGDTSDVKPSSVGFGPGNNRTQTLYKRLPGHGLFRTLTLHPGSISETLRGAIRQPISLDWQHNYDALSYRWSDPHPTDPALIEIDGVKFPIGPGLHAALVQFRHATAARHLWVDQICINQCDAEDKLQQIKIMGNIYSKAEKVLIWLGEAGGQSDVAMEFFPILVSHLQRNDEISHMQHSNQLQPVTVESKGTLAVILNSLFERSWFGRVWTLQEAALAKKAEIWCGRKSFPLRILESFEQGCISDLSGHWTAALAGISSGSAGNDPENPRRPLIAHLHTISMLKRGGRVTSARILESLRDLDCTVDQDRIYSVLRFFDSDLSEAIVQRKPPSPAELYKLVAVHAIRRGEGEYLAAAGLSQHHVNNAEDPNSSTRSSLALPSWVPDWTCKLRTRSYWVHNHDQLVRRNRSLFTAGGPSLHKRDWAFSDEDKLLHVTGVILDRVTECAPPFYFSQLPDAWGDSQAYANAVRTANRAFRSYISSSMQLATKCDSNYGSANVKRTCRQSLMGGMMPESATKTSVRVLARATDEALESSFDGFEKFMSVMAEVDDWNARIHQADLEGTWKFTAAEMERMREVICASAEVNESFQKENLIQGMADACKGRCFFVTGSKCYMGVGPDITRPGDEICVLPGCCAPFVIRKKGTRYQLIGECYVAGIMDGETITSGKYSLEAIVIE